MTADEGKPIIQNGWKSAGVEDALRMAKGKTSSFDPFFLTPPITSMTPQAVKDEEILTSMGVLSCNEEDDNFTDDNAWVMEGHNQRKEQRNLFLISIEKS